MWCCDHTRPSVPCPSPLDFPSPVCLTSVRAPYHPEARYTSLAPAQYLNTMQLLMHKHTDATWTWPIANAAIPLCSHLTTRSAVYVQNDSKSVKWQWRSLCCAATLYDDINPMCLSCYDICTGGDPAPAQLVLGQRECRPAGGLGRRNIGPSAWYGTTGLVWVHPISCQGGLESSQV